MSEKETFLNIIRENYDKDMLDKERALVTNDSEPEPFWLIMHNGEGHSSVKINWRDKVGIENSLNIGALSWYNSVVLKNPNTFTKVFGLKKCLEWKQNSQKSA